MWWSELGEQVVCMASLGRLTSGGEVVLFAISEASAVGLDVHAPCPRCPLSRSGTM